MTPKYLLALAALTLGAAATAQMTDMAMPPASGASATSAATMTTGEALKVDRTAAKVTLRHGPIDNLGMPAMTMVFRVTDQKMLDGIKAGDPVRFRAERVDGATVVTRIDAAK